jgi:SAM-dependent methyltransferase
MTGEFSESWLSLREPADAESRAAELVPLIPGPVRVIRDLGCGTGSLGRWLAPKLPTPQHWVMMDRDPALLDYAREHMQFDGVTVETVLGDVTSLTAADLAGTDLVTCSALLDLLTDPEITALAEVCAASRTPALFTLSVSGEVTVDPPVPSVVGEAFNQHQRRVVDGRRLLGPDAPNAAIAAFEKVGATVVPRPSSWHLNESRLLDTWLHGWLSAAAEQRQDLDPEAYSKDRRAATVGHVDLLAIFG